MMIALRLVGEDKELRYVLFEFGDNGGDGIEEAQEDLAMHGSRDAVIK